MNPKNFVFCLGFLILSHANAQYFSAKVDAFGLLPARTRVFRLQGEVSLTRFLSASLSYENGAFKSGVMTTNTITRQEVYRVTGWGLMPEIRWYLFPNRKPAPIGFFISPFFRYRRITEKYTGYDDLRRGPTPPFIDITTKGHNYTTGLALGANANIKNFVVGWLLGAGLGNNSWERGHQRSRITSQVRTYADRSLSLRLELNIGFIIPSVKSSKVIEDQNLSALNNDEKMEEKARVIIYRKRKFIGSLISYKIKANDSVLTKIKNGSYFEYTAQPGRITFTAKTEETSSLTLDLQAGREYYIRCGTVSGIFVYQPLLELMDPAQGKKESEKRRKKQR